jgi:uncharacterized protein YqeY
MKMSLYQKLCSDLITARVNAASITKSVLSCVIADAVKLACVKVKRDPTDDECISVIKKAKVGQESILALGLKVSASAHQRAYDEIEILDNYLPTVLTEDALRTEIKEYCGSTTRSLGDVMGYLKRVFPNQYDGKLATTIAREFI